VRRIWRCCPKTLVSDGMHCREVFTAMRWIVRAGALWRLLPQELPPWPVVYQQTQRWIAAGCFEAMVHDLRALLRLSTALRRSSRQWCWMVARCSPRRKWSSGWLRRAQEEAWLQDPCGGGHTREPAGAGGHPGFGTGAVPK
jgi:transposase